MIRTESSRRSQSALAPHLWPDDIVGSVKAIQVGPHGLKVTFVHPLQARRTILEQTGRFKSVAAPIGELAAAIRADLDAHGRHNVTAHDDDGDMLVNRVSPGRVPGV